ncbi:CsgG/HfaB family protein [Orenia marismortui]|uniref:CsgG/HfaB family protein n=1 Tax=Orenia marismortui TaxID=46469 RepID=UPI00035D5B31|nr:CsgG/HfaB family protein [Orenia marismortui]
MSKKYIRNISIMLIVFIFVSFVGIDYAQAQSVKALSANSDGGSSSSEKGVIGALVVLGIWGVYKLVKGHREKKYSSYLNKAKMYLKEEEYGLAINNLKEAKEIKDNAEVNKLLYEAEANYKKAHYNLGAGYLEEGNWELAYKEFEKVMEYDKNYLDVRQKYNQAYQELKKIKTKRIAVIDFEDTTYRYNLGSRATSLFSAYLLEREPKFIELIERDKLNTVLDEQKLGASGLIDSSTAKELGNILGVDYLVLGKVLSGSVTSDKDYEYVEDWEGQEKKRYNVEKQAYTQIIFKVLDVSDASIILSKKVTKKSRYEDSYYEGNSVIIPSDEELIDDVLSKAVDEFAQIVYEKYEL